MNERLDIITLGRFHVQKGETVLTEKNQKSTKIWELFQYFVSNPEKYTPADELADIINLSIELRDARNALENLIYRLRKLLATNEEYDPEKYIKFNRGSYGLNLDTDLYLDFLEFKNYFQLGEKHYEAGDYQTALQYFYKCFDLYNGKFIPENSEIPHILQKRHYYRNLFLDQGEKTCDILLKKQDYKQLEKVSYKILQVEPFEERFHKKLIEALINQGRMEDARNHYDYTCTLFDKSPKDLSSEFFDIFSKIDYEKNQRETDNNKKIFNIDDIYSKINEKDSDHLIYLDSETFKKFVILETRKKERTNNSRYLVSLNFKLEKIKKSQTKKNEILKKIKHIFSKSIRKSDIICRWNKNHFLLLITVNSEEIINKIISRIRQDFNDLNLPAKVTFNADYRRL
ncbi:MAG: BTAD domain-containing putative transcriptional regulator [Bacillota bacterium]